MTRILLLSPVDCNISQDFHASGLVDPDTEIIQRSVGYVSHPPVSAHDWTLADLAVMGAGQDAEAEGFNAVCLCDFGDYGAGALRSLLNIPVITAGRASMLHALTLGSRFSILATERDFLRIKKTVHNYALLAQCSGVHSVTPTTDISTLTSEAEVLVLAGEARSLKLSGVAVPVVDPLPLVIKLAESLVGLRLTHSRRAYPIPEVRKAELIAGASRIIS